MRRLRPGWNSGGVWLAMAACLTLPEPDTVATQERPTFTLVELAPRVVAAVVVADPPHYAFANSLIVDLGGELLVVDTQQSPAAADALIAAIRSRWAEPRRAAHGFPGGGCRCLWRRRLRSDGAHRLSEASRSPGRLARAALLGRAG